MLLVTVLTLLYGVLFLPSEFTSMPSAGLQDFLMIAYFWVITELGIFGLLLLLSLSRKLFAVAFPLLTILCGVMTYYRYVAHVSLTPMMIELLLVNDMRTDIDAISPVLIVVLLAIILSTIGVVWYRYRRLGALRGIRKWVVFTVSGILMVWLSNNVLPYNVEVKLRMPFSFYYNLNEYLESERQIMTERPQLAEDAECMADSFLVVYIQGESLRSDHLQLNGYQRNTTPLLCNEPNVVSLPNVHSHYSYTHLSVPYQLTRADSIHPERARTEQSLISVLKRVGYRTSWLSNQDKGTTFSYMIGECDTVVYANRGGAIALFDAWLDGDLLPLLDEELQQGNAAGQRQFILLHTIGSHWFYNSHFNAASQHFQPLAEHRVVFNNSNESLVNSYDNTIVYSDWFWHEVIDRIRHRKALLIYLSDHGESLGEDGHYWHGADLPQEMRPACFVWYSNRYAEAYPEKIAALKANSTNNYGDEMLFHSLLGGAGIRSGVLLDSLNIFSNHSLTAAQQAVNEQR